MAKKEEILDAVKKVAADVVEKAAEKVVAMAAEVVKEATDDEPRGIRAQDGVSRRR